MTARASDTDDAVTVAADELYGVPLGRFVVERKRLADDRKAAGDKAAAAAILKLARPAMSAWVVNRLWRDAREDMEGLMTAGTRVREGDRSQLEVQRAHLARLRAKAAAVLVGDGHAAAPATLQRIATTLQALSALGTWEPDRPGQLVEDRDPPGFDVMAGAALEAAIDRGRARTEPAVIANDAGARRRAATVDRRARAAERARQRAGERAALQHAAATAQRELEEKTALRDRARVEVEAAETTLARARARLASAELAQDEAADRAGRADAALAAHDLETEAEREAAEADDDGADDE